MVPHLLRKVTQVRHVPAAGQAGENLERCKYLGLRIRLHRGSHPSVFHLQPLFALVPRIKLHFLGTVSGSRNACSQVRLRPIDLLQKLPDVGRLHGREEFNGVHKKIESPLHDSLKDQILIFTATQEP